MKNAVFAEFLKIRRLRVLLLAVIVSILAPLVKMLRSISASSESMGWRGFLTSGQELFAFSMLITVILFANYIFTMEYRLGTGAAVFTSNTKRSCVFTAKLLTVAIIVVLLFIISALSQLLFGYITVSETMPKNLFGQFVSVMMWYAFSFILLAAVVALPAVLTKRFVITAVITLGYYILVFPFHSKNLYACPFMTPAVIAAKIYDSADYIFSFDYKNIEAGLIQASFFLESLALVSFVAGILVYRKSGIHK